MDRLALVVGGWLAVTGCGPEVGADGGAEGDAGESSDADARQCWEWSTGDHLGVLGLAALDDGIVVAGASGVYPELTRLDGAGGAELWTTERAGVVGYYARVVPLPTGELLALGGNEAGDNPDSGAIHAYTADGTPSWEPVEAASAAAIWRDGVWTDSQRIVVVGATLAGESLVASFDATGQDFATLGTGASTRFTAIVGLSSGFATCGLEQGDETSHFTVRGHDMTGAIVWSVTGPSSGGAYVGCALESDGESRVVASFAGGDTQDLRVYVGSIADGRLEWEWSESRAAGNIGGVALAPDGTAYAAFPGRDSSPVFRFGRDGAATEMVLHEAWLRQTDLLFVGEQLFAATNAVDPFEGGGIGYVTCFEVEGA